MERAVALGRFDALTLDDLPERIRTYQADRFVMSADNVEEIITLEELERRYIARALKLLNGNKARAAQRLGVDRRTLHRRLGRYARDDARQAKPGANGAAAGAGARA
jgi:two-component system response regulator HydG